MTITITLEPTANGQHVSLIFEDPGKATTMLLGYDNLDARVMEHIQNKLRPMVNAVSDDARRIRASMRKGA